VHLLDFLCGTCAGTRAGVLIRALFPMADRYHHVGGHSGGYFPKRIHGTPEFFPNSIPRETYQPGSFTIPLQFGNNPPWPAVSNQQPSVNGDQQFVKQFEEKVIANKQQYLNTSPSLKVLVCYRV